MSRKDVVRPTPDANGVKREVLERVAAWMDKDAAVEDLFGPQPRRKRTVDEEATMEKGLQMAIEYVRAGATR